jgi:hypothetical protein
MSLAVQNPSCMEELQNGKMAILPEGNGAQALENDL